MSDLFKKLNTLVRAQIDSVLEDDLNLPTRRRNRQPIDPASKDADRIIAKMRKEIDDAITHQEELEAKIDGLDVNATILNQRIDEALLANQEAQARHLAGRLKQLDQQITMAQAELDMHRQKTATLMDDVNLIEGLVAEARSQQQEASAVAPDPEPQQVTIPVSVEPPDESANETPDEAPEKSKPIIVSIAVEPDSAEEPEQSAPPKAEPQQPQPKEDRDNMAARRARLAAPPANKEE